MIKKTFETAESVAFSVDCVSHQSQFLEEVMARKKSQQQQQLQQPHQQNGKSRMSSVDFASLSKLVGRISKTISRDFDNISTSSSSSDPTTTAAETPTKATTNRQYRYSCELGGRLSAQHSQWTELVKFKNVDRTSSNFSVNSSRNSSRSTRTNSTISCSEYSFSSDVIGREFENNNNTEEEESAFNPRNDDLDDLNDLNRLYQHMPHEWKEVLHEETEIREESAERLIRQAYPRASELLNPDELIGLIL